MVAMQKDKRREGKAPKPTLEPINTAGENGNTAFARALGSTDYMTREKGVQALTRWLQLRADIPENDMLKLWKGLYFCFWHSDKAPVQAELAERLAAIMGMLTEEGAFRYWSLFIATMRREWFSIDKLRLDKFLMLIRKFVHAMFLHLRQHKWRTDLLERYMGVVRDTILLPTDNQRAIGLAYHLCDIYVPELHAALAATATGSKQQQPGRLSETVLRLLLEPFATTLVRAGEQAMVTRVREAVYETLMEELVDEGRGGEDEEAAARPAPLLSMLSIPEVASELFDAGAQPEVKARNRTALYEISQQLEKLATKKRKLGPGAGSSNGTVAGASASGGGARQPLADAAQPQVANGVKKGSKASKGQQAAGGENGSVLVGNGVAGAGADPVGSDEQGTGKGKKSKRKAPDTPAGGAAVVQQTEEEQAPQLVPVSAAKSGKKKGKGAAAQQAEDAAPSTSPQVAQQQAAGAARQQAPPPKSALKVKGGESVLKGKGVAAAAAPATAGPRVRIAETAADGAGAGPGSAAQVAAANGKTPRAGSGGKAAAASAAAAAAASEKKSVRINLKKNLYFAFGGPLPDPDVRTPSRSKGGILKKTGVIGRFGIPRSAPAKMNTARNGNVNTPGSAGSNRSQNTPSSAGSAGRGRQTPKSAPRARAALFF